jgi:hypothetical protein
LEDPAPYGKGRGDPHAAVGDAGSDIVVADPVDTGAVVSVLWIKRRRRRKWRWRRRRRRWWWWWRRRRVVRIGKGLHSDKLCILLQVGSTPPWDPILMVVTK